MKARLSIILFIVSASLAALLLVQWRQLSSQKNLTEKLQFQVEEMQGEIQSARREKEAIEQENATLQQQLRNAQLQAASPRQDLSNPAAATPPAVNPASASSPDSSRKSAAHPLAMVAEMMKDPDTRKGLEQQQMMGINMIYGPLLKKTEPHR